MFGCPIITQEPLDSFASNCDWELGRPTGLFLAWFRDSKLSGFTFIQKISQNRSLRPSPGKRRE